MSLTHLKGLSLTPDPRGATALEVTGTTTLSRAAITGTTILSGNVTASATGKTLTTNNLTLIAGAALKVTTGANGSCGIKAVATAGTGRVGTTLVTADSRILLTPKKYLKGISACIGYASTGTAFQIRLTRIQTAGTVVGCTGPVTWLLIDG